MLKEITCFSFHVVVHAHFIDIQKIGIIISAMSTTLSDLHENDSQIPFLVPIPGIDERHKGRLLLE